jgi:hypothetical protein
MMVSVDDLEFGVNDPVVATMSIGLKTTSYVSQCVSPWSPIHESPQETFALGSG